MTVDLSVGATATTAPVPVVDGTLPEYAQVLGALDAYVAAQQKSAQQQTIPKPS